jgi:hypothetical protein
VEGSHDRGSEDRVLPVADQLAAMTAAGGDGVGGADAAQNDAALAPEGRPQGPARARDLG